MAPHNKPVTLSDLESQGGVSADSRGNILCTNGNTTWSTNVGLWAVLVLVGNLMHPPALLLFILNGALLGLNLQAVHKAGRANIPQWLYVIIVLQVLITLQYAQITVSTLFR